MKRLIFKVVAALLVIVFAGSACQRDARQEHHSTSLSTSPPSAAISSDDRSRNLQSAGCSLRKGDIYWCHLDFVRLATMARLFNGETIYLTGYLVVDSGSLALYASEEDFRYKQLWRSVRIRGDIEELNAVAAGHLYQYVRLEGTFNSKDRIDLEAGRLGTLLPPFAVRLAEVENDRPSIDDIRLDSRDLNK